MSKRTDTIYDYAIINH